MSNLTDLTQPHIDSFDALFTQSVIENVVANLDTFEIKHEESILKIAVEDVTVLKPFISSKEYVSMDRRLLPKECRDRSASYKGKVIVKYGLMLNSKHIGSIEKSAGYMPIMVKSKFCHLQGLAEKELVRVKEDEEELGGYFIVNGIEKIIRFLIIQKRNYIFGQVKPSFAKKGKNITDKAVMARCVGADEIASVLYVHYAIDGNLILRVFYQRREYMIPLALILKYLSKVTDEDIFNALYYKEDSLLRNRIEFFLRKSSENTISELEEKVVKIFYDKELTGKEAIALFIKKTVAVHLERNEDKYFFLVEAIKKLYRLVDNEIVAEDQDSQMNHEILGVTQLFAIIIKEKLEESLRLARFLFQKKPFALTRNQIMEKLKLEPTIGNRIESFLATGAYNMDNCSDILQNNGFSVVAEKLNFYRFLSHFRCVNRGSFFTTIKVTTVRRLRPESFGFLCPVHTPDGTPCGLLTHLSSKATIVFKNENFDIGVLFKNGVIEKRLGIEVEDSIVIFMDGRVLGLISKRESQELYNKVIKYRNDSGLNFEVVYKQGLSKIDEGIFIFTNLSRFVRSIYNKELHKEEKIGIMEQVFLDINMANDVSSEEFRYKEVDDTGFLSVVAGLTPFSDYNQSPRNMYQCQMAKQTIGISALNIKYRTDNKAYRLNYCQEPIVRTNFYDFYKLNHYPIGLNAIVAVISYTAYDMEDAMIINKASADRGMFGSVILKTDHFSVDKNCTIIDTAQIGEELKQGSSILKYMTERGKIIVKEYKSVEEAYLESVRLYCNPTISNSLNSVTFKYRIVRDITIGDKFCSRHGQKGVCSFKWKATDMPFTESGISPDIIINPHAFPSRMTIGMLIESISGKSGCLLGKKQDGSAFKHMETGEDRKAQYCQELIDNGYNYYGNEPMYSGVHGNEFKVDIFVYCIYYQRLRHMVSDKYQVRTLGPVQPQTRQPIKGRAKQGGVRLGEMERDALIAHGCSYTLHDRLINCSDGTEFLYCGDCKSILFVEAKDKCHCGGFDIKTIKMPFVFKYLCSELFAMNIRVKISTN